MYLVLNPPHMQQYIICVLNREVIYSLVNMRGKKLSPLRKNIRCSSVFPLTKYTANILNCVTMHVSFFSCSCGLVLSAQLALSWQQCNVWMVFRSWHISSCRPSWIMFSQSCESCQGFTAYWGMYHLQAASASVLFSSLSCFFYLLRCVVTLSSCIYCIMSQRGKLLEEFSLHIHWYRSW